MEDDRLARHGVRLRLRYDDNKRRKLKYNLEAAAAQGSSTLLTFGGAYSNHLRATAEAGRRFGFQTIGVVRGEERLPLNDSLAYAVSLGMRLTYLDRSTYRRKTDPEVAAGLRERLGDFYLLPEGGSNALGVRGCAELPAEIEEPYDIVCCPCGTGGTLAGLAAGLPSGRRALGFAVLKGGRFLDRDVESLQRAAYGTRKGDWSIAYDFHFGGYARRNAELDEFIQDFAARHGVVLD